MNMIPKQHQIEGAYFLTSQKTALLADQPRVGKTGAAIMSCDLVQALRILVVTTASGRPVWRKGFEDWSVFGHNVQILLGKDKLREGPLVCIVGWPDMKTDGDKFQQVWSCEWDVIILDEGHYAKSFEAQRTLAVFGLGGLHSKASRVWVLSGTPMPNSPLDLFPMLLALAPERLRADEAKGWPDVSDFETFKAHFCEVKPKKIGFHRWIDVIIGGQNLDELAARLEGFFLRRTQEDVGITAPVFEILPLMLQTSKAEIEKMQLAERELKDRQILSGIAQGEDLKDHHLGPVRRIWGELKVKPLIDAIKEEFEGGLDKIVIAAWHKDVMQGLASGLSRYGVAVVSGETNPKHREEAVQNFQTGGLRVFIGQIQAAGEAIDLSSSSELIFAEASFVPKDMQQMAFRITNHGQKRQPRVRVAVLEGSIDEALQTVLMRKWATINEVMK